MIELIKFILEAWQNCATFILVTAFLTMCISIIVNSFKPISYKTIINEIKENKSNE